MCCKYLIMKRITIIFFTIFFLISCQKDNSVNRLEKRVVTYDVQSPVEFEIKSSSKGTGSEVNALWYGVYHKKSDGNYVYMSDMSAYVSIDDPTKNISVPVTLFKDQQYKIIFVAQHIESVASGTGSNTNCYTYIVNENGLMSLNPSAVITDGEQLDAFIYWEETDIIKNDYKKEIVLTRPLAQVNISTDATVTPVSIDLAISGTAAAYDIFAKTYSTATANPVIFNNFVCDGNDLATVYILPVGSSITIDMTMTYADDSTKSLNVSNVAVAPNFKTNVKGNI